jgi:hypothetical protein
MAKVAWYAHKNSKAFTAGKLGRLISADLVTSSGSHRAFIPLAKPKRGRISAPGGSHLHRDYPDTSYSVVTLGSLRFSPGFFSGGAEAKQTRISAQGGSHFHRTYLDTSYSVVILGPLKVSPSFYSAGAGAKDLRSGRFDFHRAYLESWSSRWCSHSRASCCLEPPNSGWPRPRKDFRL